MQNSQPQAQKTIECPNCHFGQPNIKVKECQNCHKLLAYCEKYQTLVVAESSKCYRCNTQFIECSKPTCQRKLHEDMKKCYFCNTEVVQVTNSANGHAQQQNPSSFATTGPEPLYASNNGSASSPSQGASLEEKNKTPAESLIAIENTLLDLKKKIEIGEAEKYFPGEQQDKAEMLQKWEQEIKLALALVHIAQNHIWMLNTHQVLFPIRTHLTKVAHNLNFIRKYEVKAIGETAAGKSTALAAITHEESVFISGHGKSMTAVRTQANFYKKENLKDGEEMRVYLINGEVKRFLRPEWETQSKIFFIQPESGSPEEKTSRVMEVDYVEFALDAQTHPLLPMDSSLVDLPGAGSGIPLHTEKFIDELQNVDAIIFFVKSVRPNNAEVQNILDIFAEVASASQWSQRPNVTARKIFLVGTHWEGTDDKENKKTTLEGMNTLVKNLTKKIIVDYASFNPRNRNTRKKVDAYYPLRGLVAFFAQRFIQRIEQKEYENLDEKQLAEKYDKLDGKEKEYLGAIGARIDELRAFKPGLIQRSPHEVMKDKEYHEAMLGFSGLSELMRDLQKFLTENRFTIQIEEAQSEMKEALFILNTLAWIEVREYTKKYNLTLLNNDVDELEKVLQANKDRRQEHYEEEMEKRVNGMRSAWETARKCCIEELCLDDMLKNSEFHRVLVAAHDNAKTHVAALINSGSSYLDETIITNEQIYRKIGGMPRRRSTSNINHAEFLSRLCECYRVIIEDELGSPIEKLWDTFLLHLMKEESKGGALDISEVVLENFDQVPSFYKKYNDIRNTIKRIAYDACVNITLSILFGETEILKDDKGNTGPLRVDQGAIEQLKTGITNSNKSEAALKKDAHPLMERVLDEMVEGIVRKTEFTIASYFRYELNKLFTYYDYDWRLPGSNSSGGVVERKGKFEEYLKKLNGALRDQIKSSQVLRDRLDLLLFADEAQIEHWVNVIREIERVRKGEVEEPVLVVEAAMV